MNILKRLLPGVPVVALCALYLAVQPMPLLAALFFVAGSLVTATLTVAL